MQSDGYERLHSRYQDRGYAGRVGFGHRPAVVVVDLILAFTDQRCPMASRLDTQVEATNTLIDQARAVAAPIIFTTIAYGPDLADAGIWIKKIPSNQWLITGTDWVEPDPRLHRRHDDPVLTRKAASGFFNTPLADHLLDAGIDTVLVAGCTTSGCVRATVVDACSHGFRTIVAEETVGDRATRPHRASLFDMNAKYADVIPLADAVYHLESHTRG